MGNALTYADGNTDRQMDGTKVTGVFCDFANTPTNVTQVTHIHSFPEILCDKHEGMELETECILKVLEFKIYAWKSKENEQIDLVM